ncbi:uncharacterized protein STEHIDRAFT_108133 [Stereum hirsutum FP-91666 SS1]|uniref:uncharacterized protein n=1 Tax=Stereum hirsutum (strain FP-91666) TaxID=721885 RepID=UPI000440B48D|nr:uncharacterized protein STEHIDRAFT_108133 [Stereum hirsutum FP-91666 SS1]EIM91624.1 hypothetical protein STEHIDRAFT_108133 [Stereum hirsutum FP-91666 SS1]
MLFSITSFVALLAASSTLVGGASLKRQSGDNGSCAQLGRICAGDVQNDLSNLWAVESCLFAGVCFERNGSSLDGFYGNLWVELGHTSRPPLTLYTPRVTQAVFNSISNNGPGITQQNFIDGYYAALSATGGPYPDNALVIGDFHRIATWTDVCGAGQGIPYSNFADYFQYSATNPANFCP